jgi:hypothetical protein
MRHDYAMQSGLVSVMSLTIKNLIHSEEPRLPKTDQGQIPLCVADRECFN